MDIGFFYVPYYPLTASRSVHGYHLVRALKKRGHRILSCLGEGDPDCVSFERTKRGALALARQADVLYIRVAGSPAMSYLEKATLLKLVRPLSLPVVWEVNAPIEEMLGSMAPGAERERLIKKENIKRRLLARFVDGAVGVSRVMQDYIKNELGIRRACCIPNAADPDAFAPGRVRETALGHVQNMFKVFWAGNAATPWQGIDLMLRVAGELRRTDPDILFVLMTGESLWQFPVERNLLVLRGVPHGDLPHYVAAADLCLCLYEKYDWLPWGFYGSSLKLFDYMAAGKPVLASDMGQLSEIVRHDINGVLVQDSAASIAGVIRALKHDPARRKRLGDNARADVIRSYTWDHVAQKTEALLADVCRR